MTRNTLLKYQRKTHLYGYSWLFYQYSAAFKITPLLKLVIYRQKKCYVFTNEIFTLHVIYILLFNAFNR